MAVKTEFSDIKMFVNGLAKDDSEYEKKFLEIYLHYLQYFTNKPLLQDVKYVPHDLPHSVRVLEAFCDLIDPNATMVLDSRTWFIIGTAVYLHDISMQFSPTQRRKHGADSAAFIQKQANTEGNPIHALDQNDIYCIHKIVYAHTNPPGVSTEEVFKSIDSTYPPGKGTILLKQLAAMVRIADELDISRDRVKTYNKGDYGIEINADVNPINDESYVHWEKCEIFIRPQIVQLISQRYYKINLVTIRLALEDRINQYGYRITSLLIVIVCNKIRKALFEMKTYGDICQNGYCKDISSVDLILDPPDLELENSYFELSVESIKESSIATEIRELLFPIETAKRKLNLNLTSIDVTIVTNEAAIEFQKQLQKINFVESGHYRVSNTHCVHDWFNCTLLVHNRLLSDIIIKCIVDDILSKIPENRKGAPELPDVIFGVDTNGFLLASKVAMQLCLPFSSYIPSRYNNEISEMDKNIFGEFATNCKHIVLITDVIIFGEAVAQAIAAIKKLLTIENANITIYTMFFRDTRSKFDAELEGVHVKSLTPKYYTTLIEENECIRRLNGRCADTKKPLLSDGGVLCDK